MRGSILNAKLRSVSQYSTVEGGVGESLRWPISDLILPSRNTTPDSSKKPRRLLFVSSTYSCSFVDNGSIVGEVYAYI